MKKTCFSLFIILLFSIINSPLSHSQIFYKISGNGMEKPSYLLGTHHLAPLAVLDSISSFNDAFENVEQVVGEIDMTMDQLSMAAIMQPYTMAPSDSTLTKLIDPTTFQRINDLFTQEIGLPLSMFDQTRPMIPMTIFTVGIMSKLMPGYNPQEQIDSYLQTEGKERGLNISPLESLEEQARLLYTELSLTRQAEELVKMIDDPGKTIESAKSLTDAYLRGDIDALYKISLEDNSEPIFFEKLTKKRNEAWLEKIPGLINEKPSLIAVGALHLCGDDGLINGLRKAGYVVEPQK